MGLESQEISAWDWVTKHFGTIFSLTCNNCIYFYFKVYHRVPYLRKVHISTMFFVYLVIVLDVK